MGCGGSKKDVKLPEPVIEENVGTYEVEIVELEVTDIPSDFGSEIKVEVPELPPVKRGLFAFCSAPANPETEPVPEIRVGAPEQPPARGGWFTFCSAPAE